MWEFKVLVFAPGHSPSGVRARLSFQGDALVVRGRRIHLTTLCQGVNLRSGGYDGRQWMLSWRDETGEVSALLQGEKEMLLMRQYAPPALAAQLERAIRASRWRGRRLRLLLVLLLGLPLLLLGLFWIGSERIAGWVAGHVDLKTEQQLGRLTFDQMRPGLKLVETGPAPAVTRQIGERLTRGSAYDYRWFVADNPEINAFAMPGGYVVVYTGLIRATGSAEELAGVLAHEVQHVELRHSLKNLVHGLGWRALLSLALGDLGGGVWVDLAAQLGGLKYGRDLEREADLKGLEALRRAGIAPEGMAAFFARLAAREGPVLPLLSSHPTCAERLASLRRAAADMGGYPHQPLPYRWDEVRRGLP